jgi:Flp pilus assembly pilin Flp
MNTMKSNKLINRRTARSERGAAMIDYAILTSLIAVVSLGSLMAFGNQIQRVYCERIMQVAFLDARKAGELEIRWDDSNPKEKSCRLEDSDIDVANRTLF